jgi:hypothetical protein
VGQGQPQPVEQGTAQLGVGPQALPKKGRRPLVLAARWSRAKPQRQIGGAKKNPSAREGSSDGQRLAFSSQPPTSRPTPRDKASRYGVLEAETATRNPT